MKDPNLLNLTPGEFIEEEFMKPLGLSPSEVAKGLGLPPVRLNQILRGSRRITTETALRLGAYFNTGPDIWLGIQIECDLRAASRTAERIRKEVRPLTECLGT